MGIWSVTVGGSRSNSRSEGVAGVQRMATSRPGSGSEEGLRARVLLRGTGGGGGGASSERRLDGGVSGGDQSELESWGGGVE
uniref:Terminal repeat region n=1 Tax=Latid herpesvirus 1 TaxID=3096545 RepID=A0AB33V6W7_9VIRU